MYASRAIERNKQNNEGVDKVVFESIEKEMEQLFGSDSATPGKSTAKVSKNSKCNTKRRIKNKDVLNKSSDEDIDNILQPNEDNVYTDNEYTRLRNVKSKIIFVYY